MSFKFVSYEPKKRTRNKVIEPIVQVKSNGRVSFNKPAAELLEGKEYCTFGYDSENKAIGILPVAEKGFNTFSIRHTARGAYIGAKAFLKYAGLVPSVNIDSVPIKDKEYIVIKL